MIGGTREITKEKKQGKKKQKLYGQERKPKNRGGKIREGGGITKEENWGPQSSVRQ